jgi:hypothetical protein
VAAAGRGSRVNAGDGAAGSGGGGGGAGLHNSSAKKTSTAAARGGSGDQRLEARCDRQHAATPKFFVVLRHWLKPYACYEALWGRLYETEFYQIRVRMKLMNSDTIHKYLHEIPTVCAAQCAWTAGLCCVCAPQSSSLLGHDRNSLSTAVLHPKWHFYFYLIFYNFSLHYAIYICILHTLLRSSNLFISN